MIRTTTLVLFTMAILGEGFAPHLSRVKTESNDASNSEKKGAVLCHNTMPIQNTHDPIPFNHLSQLDSCVLLNDFRYAEKKPVVNIYTFLACKPCLQLAKKMNTLSAESAINSTQIIYVNPVDWDSQKVKQHIDKHEYQSAYYLTKWPEFEGDFPKIAGYDSVGNLVWIEFGYNKKSLVKILSHLNNDKN